MDDKKYTSSSLERQVIGYLKPRVYQMFMVDMYLHYRGKSEHTTFIINKFYASLSEHQQKELLAQYETVKEKYVVKRGAHKKI